jgi:hypothetical protein
LSEPLAPAAAQTSAAAPTAATARLARFIVSTRYEDLPEAVRHEAKRTLLNWVGCAIGGSPRRPSAMPARLWRRSRDHARRRCSAGRSGWTRSTPRCSTA